MKRLIGGGLAALALGLGLAAPAQAETETDIITSTVFWTGPDCIPVRVSTGFSTKIDTACGGYATRSYYAVPGQYVGADPMPFDTTVTLGCSLLINGVPDNADYAPSGDRHDVDCLRVLVSSYPSYQPPPPVYQPPPLLRAS